MKTASRHSRGLTLIELMVATLIMVTAIATAMVTFISMTRSLWSADQARAANGAARDAMVPIESALRDLGWGVDPRFAIDMTTAVRTRDSITDSDELTFLARNPAYNWLDNGDKSPFCSPNEYTRISPLRCGSP